MIELTDKLLAEIDAHTYELMLSKDTFLKLDNSVKVKSIFDSTIQHKLEFGDWVIIEYYHLEKNNRKVYRPVLATFHSCLPCDQTVEMIFNRAPRTWMNNIKYNPNPNFPTYKSQIVDCLHYQGTISVIPWGENDLNIIGHWKQKPKFGELRTALKKSIFYQNL